MTLTSQSNRGTGWLQSWHVLLPIGLIASQLFSGCAGMHRDLISPYIPPFPSVAMAAEAEPPRQTWAAQTSDFDPILKSDNSFGGGHSNLDWRSSP